MVYVVVLWLCATSVCILLSFDFWQCEGQGMLALTGDCVMMPLMMQPPPQHQPFSKHTNGEACGPLMHLGKVPLLYWQRVPTLKGSRHHLWLP